MKIYVHYDSKIKSFDVDDCRCSDEEQPRVESGVPEGGQWTSGGSSLGKSNYVKPPFPKPDNAASISHEIEDWLVEHDETEAPIEDVPMDKLQTLQSVNTKSKVEGLKGFKQEGDINLPVVARKNGEYYLFDGNHRAHAAKNDGDAYLRSRVISLDSEISPKNFGEKSGQIRPLAGQIRPKI